MKVSDETLLDDARGCIQFMRELGTFEKATELFTRLADRLEAALASQPQEGEAGPVAVKPLDWREVGDMWQGRGFGSHYDIYKDGKRWRVWLHHKSTADFFNSLDDAKAACESEYAERILSNIEVAHPPTDTPQAETVDRNVRINKLMRELWEIVQGGDPEGRTKLNAVWDLLDKFESDVREEAAERVRKWLVYADTTSESDKVILEAILNGRDPEDT